MSSIPAFFWVGFVLVLVNLALSQVLMSHLQNAHPDEFRAMGEPHLVLNNTPRSNALFWKWLWAALFQTDRLGRKVALLVRVLWTLTALFCGWFVAGIAQMFLG